MTDALVGSDMDDDDFDTYDPDPDEPDYDPEPDASDWRKMQREDEGVFGDDDPWPYEAPVFVPVVLTRRLWMRRVPASRSRRVARRRTVRSGARGDPSREPDPAELAR